MKAMRTSASQKDTLVILILTLLLFALGAAAEGKDIILFDVAAGHWQNDDTQKVVSIKGTLYIARVDGLYSWNMGDEARQLMDFTKVGIDGSPIEGQTGMLSPISELMSDGTALYALDGKMEGLWRFDDAADIFVKEASFIFEEAFLEGGGSSYLYSNFLMEGGNVYYTVLDTMTGSGSLIRVDVKSGKAERLKTGIYMAVPYYPGKLIVANGPHGWPDSVSVLDLATGSLMYKMDISNDARQIYYEIGSDMLYIVRKGAIYTSVAFGETRLAARIPVISPLPGGTHLNGGYAALAYEDGIRVYTCDPAAVTGETLTFVGPTFELPMEDYSVLHPDVTFAFSDFYPMNTAELVTHMMSGDGAADIYSIKIGVYSLDALYERGYFAGLQSSQTIVNTISAMYPFVKEQLMRDGKVIVMPFYNNFITHQYNPKAFEEIGLHGADVPKTYEELLDFITLWGEKYREKYSTMSLFGQNVDIKLYKRIVAQTILEDRMYACIRSGQPVTYDTAEMQALLAKLTATDFSVVNALASDSSYEEYADLDHPPRQLFYIWGTACAQTNYTDFFSYMPLRLNTAVDPVVVSDMEVLLVNPYSLHFDQALAFVEYVASNLDTRMRVDLMPGENEPVRYPGFDVAWYYTSIKETEVAIAAAKEEDKRTLSDRLDVLKKELENELRFEWLVTAQSVAEFRALDPYFMLRRPNPLTGIGYSQEITDLFYNRFLQGQISAEQFLKELDQKMLMIEREN